MGTYSIACTPIVGTVSAIARDARVKAHDIESISAYHNLVQNLTVY